MAATTGLGVLRPRSAVNPLPEMNACDARSARTDSSVAGPTSAWMDRRSVPPVNITSTRGASISACATSNEFVTTVSSGLCTKRRANAKVVVPGPSTIESPGRTISSARRAMAAFSPAACCAFSL